MSARDRHAGYPDLEVTLAYGMFLSTFNYISMKQQLICLLVDDDEEDQDILKDAIDEVVPQAEYFTASDGVQAIHILSQGNVRPDYIFLDINMPRMNGFEFLEKIKGMPDLKNIPVVIHSTSTNPWDIAQLKELGAFSIYKKENHFDGVCKMLTKIFGRNENYGAVRKQ